MRLDYILGYGSLLSRFSREHYSSLRVDPIPVTLTGWSKAWCIQDHDEGATYLGAYPRSGAHLSGALLPTKITPTLIEREKRYTFDRVKVSDISPVDAGSSDMEQLQDATFWIAHAVNRAPTCPDTPVPQTYIDTCLTGCLELGGARLAHAYIDQFESWQVHWVNDRDHTAPIYPRLVPLDARGRDEIDSLLDAADVLQHRQASEAPS